ncbi:MAG: serine/threonine-protein kinase [Dehalococcoidia bacterium]
MKGEILSNRYLIAEEIGVGGMGMVYRAVNLRTGGDVAIKVPHAYLVRNVEYMNRLSREAQIAASLYSPRIVRVIDLDTHEGTPYLVMEYVPGDTLADSLRQRGRFTLPETLALGLEVARALDAANLKGVTHRDLKPQNIKLVDGEVKVLDFGIAKGEGFAKVTANNAFVGTPEYCAPEQSRGEGDIRSDIYSLGVILFEMHEGHIPFEAASPFAMIRKHETEPAPPLTGDVPEAVREIIARCLAKSPADRYQTPRELVQALRAVLEAPTGAHPALAMPEGVSPAVRHPNLSESGAMPPTLHIINEQPLDIASEPAKNSAAGQGSANAPRSRRGRLFAVVGIAAVVLAAGAILAMLLIDRSNGDAADGGTDAVTAAAAGLEENGSPTPSADAGAASEPLLVTGQQEPLTGQITLDWTNAGCPEVKTIVDLRSIRAEASGRVAVAYTVETPRVLGVEQCAVSIPPDANCACLYLETRLATGEVVRAANTGGNGVAATGAATTYGTPPQQGEWWFDKDVELTGVSLALHRSPSSGADYSFDVPLLRR